MESFENKPVTDPIETSDLEARVESLKHLLVSALVLMIVVSGTLNIYLWRQYKYAKQDLNLIRPQAQGVIEDARTNSAAIDGFIKKITDYSQTHPDFAPIATKYGLKAPAGAVAPAPTNALPRK